MRPIDQDLGMSFTLRVFTDATAAIGICRRRGLGRVRHLAVADLWVQDRLKARDFELHKVAGADNVADMLTKHLPRPLHEKHMAALDLQVLATDDDCASINSPVVACCLSRFWDPDTDEGASPVWESPSRARTP